MISKDQIGSEDFLFDYVKKGEIEASRSVQRLVALSAYCWCLNWLLLCLNKCFFFHLKKGEIVETLDDLFRRFIKPRDYLLNH